MIMSWRLLFSHRNIWALIAASVTNGYCFYVFLSLFLRSTRGLNWRRSCFLLGPVGGGERPGASGAPKTGRVKAPSRPYRRGKKMKATYICRW